MTVNWHSIKKDGYPPKVGRYQVTIEGAIEGLEEGPAPGERIVTIAYYYGQKGWGIIEGTGYVKAWAELLEPYIGE